MAPSLIVPTTPLITRPSLWIHGAGFSGQTWRSLVATLPHGNAPDLPGHGDAPAIAAPRVEAYADTLLPCVTDDMILIGHSLGGMVALELARRSPAIPSALVLIEAVSTVRDTWFGRIGPRIARPLLKPVSPRLLAQISAVGQSQAAQTEIHRQIGTKLPYQICAAFDAARFYDGRPHLAEVTLPTLILVGDGNSATHHGAHYMARMIPGAEYEVLHGGHMLHIDAPEAMLSAINDFLLRKTECPTPSSQTLSLQKALEGNDI